MCANIAIEDDYWWNTKIKSLNVVIKIEFASTFQYLVFTYTFSIHLIASSFSIQIIKIQFSMWIRVRENEEHYTDITIVWTFPSTSTQSNFYPSLYMYAYIELATYKRKNSHEGKRYKVQCFDKKKIKMKFQQLSCRLVVRKSQEMMRMFFNKQEKHLISFHLPVVIILLWSMIIKCFFMLKKFYYFSLEFKVELKWSKNSIEILIIKAHWSIENIHWLLIQSINLLLSSLIWSYSMHE